MMKDQKVAKIRGYSREGRFGTLTNANLSYQESNSSPGFCLIRLCVKIETDLDAELISSLPAVPQLQEMIGLGKVHETQEIVLCEIVLLGC